MTSPGVANCGGDNSLGLVRSGLGVVTLRFLLAQRGMRGPGLELSRSGNAGREVAMGAAIMALSDTDSSRTKGNSRISNIRRKARSNPDSNANKTSSTPTVSHRARQFATCT